MAKFAGLLKVLFLAHLMLSSWGMESTFRVPHSYVYYNIIFMISLMWAIANENPNSLAMAMFVDLGMIVMDGITLALYWPTGGPVSARVHFAFALANAVLRVITALVLYAIFREVDQGQGVSSVFGDVKGDAAEVFGSKGKGKGGYETLSGGQEESRPSGSKA